MARTPRRAPGALLLASASAIAIATAACGGPGLPSPVTVPRDPTPLTKCQVAASQSSPLVTEWPASEKARLEGLVSQGGVAVRYSGCEMQVLDACKLEGNYTFQRTTLSTDTIEIRSADELFAKLPLGAASLEGELGRSGRLAIRTTGAGQLVFRGDPMRLPAGGVCAGATHVITAISVGTFRMLSGGAVTAGGGASVAGAGTGGQVSRSEQTLKEAGAPERCAESTDGAAHPDCSSPIQVFLAPLPEQAAAPAMPPPPGAPPAASPEAPPPPQAGAPSQPRNGIYVRLPAAPEAGPWTLQDKGGAALCQLPCAIWLDREKKYYLARHGDGSRIELPARERLPGIEADVEMLPPRGSKLVGILGMSAGGVLVITGMVLFLNDALDDAGPAPGLLTSLGGFALAGGGLAYTLWSRGDYKPVYKSAVRDAGPVVRIGLGGVTGSF
ncbi:MAG: hypothetical protein IT372_03445 [Polyangiaceae bacterium]|nr:hypothetical protein [Polyangiaceae bacterium]